MSTDSEVYICGPHCQHPHNALNGPSGCCEEHGPYLYFCPDCHAKWERENPKRAAQISRLASRLSGVTDQ